MIRPDRNSIPDLVELSTRVSEGGNELGEGEVRVELRVHPAQLDSPKDLRFTVGLKRLWLSLDLSGLQAVSGSRFGEPIRDNEQIREHTLSTEISVENKSADNVGVKLALYPELTLKGDDSSILNTGPSQGSRRIDKNSYRKSR
jgi:hypothetical protein